MHVKKNILCLFNIRVNLTGLILFFFADKYGETPCESVKQEAPVSAKQGTCCLYDSSSVALNNRLNVCAPDFLYENVCLPQDTSGIVYTTVDFRAHQRPMEVYENLRTHSTQVGAPEFTCRAEGDGVVEYSTLAIHQ